MRSKTYLISLVMVMACFLASAQDNSTGEITLKDGTIDDKFDYIMEESSDYRAYEIIEQSIFKNLKSIVLDTLASLHKSIREQSQLAMERKDSVKIYKNILQSTKDSLNTTMNSRDSISFLGTDISKGTYKTIMWVIILFMIGAILFIYYRGRANQYLEVSARKNYEKLQEDFKAYKKRSLEREQKLNRLLTDEQNRNSEDRGFNM